MEFVPLKLTVEEVLGETPEALDKLEKLSKDEKETLGMMVLLAYIYRRGEKEIDEVVFWLNEAVMGESYLKKKLLELASDYINDLKVGIHFSLAEGMRYVCGELYHEGEMLI